MLMNEIAQASGLMPLATDGKVMLLGDDQAYRLLGVDWHNHRVLTERNDSEWLPMSIVTKVAVGKPKREGQLCNVLGCGGEAGCVHEWTNYYCTCGYRVKMVKHSRYMYCSNPDNQICENAGYESNREFIAELELVEPVKGAMSE